MSHKEFVNICQKKLDDLGLSSDLRYKKRLKWELEEIIAKEKVSYFIELYQKNVRYPKNQNNLIVCWLLGIVKDFDIDKDPNCIYGEFGDVDIDYLPAVRDYIKGTWAAKEFGENNVCNIGNYTTFGLKSALIDMARVHGENKDEVHAVTKELDAKDDEGKVLTWDAAQRLYPKLKEYCEKHPLVAEAAKKLLNRNRGMGVHAGGLIIANQPLSDLVPLVKRKDNPQASAWAEGLHGQDLSPVGLIKFDLLVVSNLLQVAKCCELVKQRRGITGICNLPGGSDWSDVFKWRDDPVSLAMADKGDLKCIFQFDSEGIRNMVKAMGVDRFEDLVAATALFRPGPLGAKGDERYIERKRGREKYSIHPLLKPVLEKTYGIMIFQEQIMQVLHIVGSIPLKDCEIVRKAISKKKLEGFIKYKEMFLTNGVKNLGVPVEELQEIWDDIEVWSEYGFNKSHSVAYTYLSSNLLYLKAHYPPEFYVSILSCEKSIDKIKEYKMEAKKHGIETHCLDINKSGVTFELRGDVIYYGLSNIKGLGEEPAKRIVAGQPYRSFEDFLFRFGTDSSVLKPILGLRCFRDSDPITLWKFAEHYKDCFKKFEDKKKRYAASLLKYEEEFKELLPSVDVKLSDLVGDNPFDLGDWRVKYDRDEYIEVDKEVVCGEGEEGAVSKIKTVKIKSDEDDGLIIERDVLKYYKKCKVKKVWNLWKELRKLWQRRVLCVRRYSDISADLPTLATFDANDWEIDDKLLKLFRDPVACEMEYYGFAWVHELELSPDFNPDLTFESVKNSDTVGPVEMKILKITKSLSKKGNDYFQIVAEDVMGQVNRINIWADDWARWGKEFGLIEDNDDGKQPKFQLGNLIRVRLQPPSGGFTTFTMESNQGKWRTQKKYVNKADDFRVIVMRPGQKEKEVFLSDDEALELFQNCVVNNE